MMTLFCPKILKLPLNDKLNTTNNKEQLSLDYSERHIPQDTAPHYSPALFCADDLSNSSQLEKECYLNYGNSFNNTPETERAFQDTSLLKFPRVQSFSNKYASNSDEFVHYNLSETEQYRLNQSSRHSFSEFGDSNKSTYSYSKDIYNNHDGATKYYETLTYTPSYVSNDEDKNLPPPYLASAYHDNFLQTNEDQKKQFSNESIFNETNVFSLQESNSRHSKNIKNEGSFTLKKNYEHFLPRKEHTTYYESDYHHYSKACTTDYLSPNCMDIAATPLYEDEPKDYSYRSSHLKETIDETEEFLENISKYELVPETQSETYLERKQIAKEALACTFSGERARSLRKNFYIEEDEPLKNVEFDRKEEGPTNLSSNIDKNKKYCTLKVFVCHICGVNLKGRTTLKSHLNIHNGIKPYECFICSKTFTQLSTLKNHQRVHTNETPFICSICSASFKTLTVLKEHRVKHFNEALYNCTICSKSFKSHLRLQKHSKTHSEKLKKVFCKHCEEKFYNQRAYLKHLCSEHREKETGHKIFHCPQCPKTYFFKSLLKNHLNVHLQEKKHMCRVCNASFVWKSGLTAHLRTHFTKLQCDICDKKFTSSKRLNKHRIRHGNPLHHKCKICFKEFNFPYQLKTHERKHTEESFKLLKDT